MLEIERQEQDSLKITQGAHHPNGIVEPIEGEFQQRIDTVTTDSYLTGWRLHLTSIGVLLCLYLVNIEVTIVSTSLVKITDELHGFNETSWVVSGYLVTYTVSISGFIIIWSKLSDIIGRKYAINLTMVIFVAFSGACGGSQTMNQLITFRAFQGIGSAGAYSMAILTVYEMVPKVKLAIYGAILSVTIALATVTGPIFAGLIDNNSTWRWIFYINLPSGVLAIALLVISMPSSFGSNATSSTEEKNLQSLVQRLDWIGAGLLLSGSLLLVTALVEATVRFAWSSGATIAMLVLSAVSWVGFFAWEWHVTDDKRKAEPIFPWRFFHNRFWIGMLLTTFFVGAPFNVVTVSLPQRFQAVNNASTLGAGVRLIPYSLVAALGSAVANVICSKKHIPPIYFLLLGGILHVIGLACLATLPTTGEYPAAAYGYEVLAGAGVGITFGVLILTTPFVVEARDLAVATGAVIQFRFLGGAIGLSIASSVLNGKLKSELRGVLLSSELTALLQTTEVIKSLSPEKAQRVRQTFVDSYNVQFKIMLGFAAAQVVATAMLLRRGKQFRTTD